MDIVVTGRHTEVTPEFRAYTQEKLRKVEKLCPKAMRVDVEVSSERNPRLADVSERVQLTCLSRGPAVRAEAAAADTQSAFDLAWEKLEYRLRQAAGRRRTRRLQRRPTSLAEATGLEGPPPAPLPAADGGRPAAGSVPHVADAIAGELAETASTLGGYAERGDLVVREKVHRAAPMTLEQALFEMELVGHDFFLFSDIETGLPSVAYRRRGYDYGIIRLITDPAGDTGNGAGPVAGRAAEADAGAPAAARRTG